MLADVEAVCRQVDPVLRNLRITQAYHEDPSLRQAPFDVEQLAAIRDGRMPGGRL